MKSQNEQQEPAIDEQHKGQKSKVLEPFYLYPFILITSCFALWGFANDITNPMVAAFEKIFMTGTTEATWIQVAFYGGYGAMAIPAALFIQKFNFKSGILVGLALYAVGAMIFIPASHHGEFLPFLLAYFIMTCGLSFLETTANPYILSMGDPATATRRLNLAQAFNPIGSLVGMFVASQWVLAQINPLTKSQRADLPSDELALIKSVDLTIISQPYIYVTCVIALIFVLIACRAMPEPMQQKQTIHNNRHIFIQLISNQIYREGVLCQMVYVGAQIMCWTFIIHYGTSVFMANGMQEQKAQVLSQHYNIIAMVLFCSSRFVCTFLMKFVQPARLLSLLALAAVLLSCGTVFIGGYIGLLCLVATSACMSLMFPTIYGIALSDMSGDQAKFAAAGLIMAIVGGTFLPLLQAKIIDTWQSPFLPAIQASFLLPLGCFIAIAIYGKRVKGKLNQHN